MDSVGDKLQSWMCTKSLVNIRNFTLERQSETCLSEHERYTNSCNPVSGLSKHRHSEKNKIELALILHKTKTHADVLLKEGYCIISRKPELNTERVCLPGHRLFDSLFVYN